MATSWVRTAAAVLQCAMSRCAAAALPRLRARKVRLIDGALLTLWVLAIWLVVIAAIPEHAVGSTKATKHFVSMLVPEGWAFFTRNSREPTYKVYVRSGEGYETANVVDEPLRTRWSPSRWDRVRSITLSAIVTQIPKQSWQGCSGALNECVGALRGDPVTVTIAMHTPAYCGQIVVKESEPVPWAWRASYRRMRLPANYARVNIDCRHLSRASHHAH